MPTATVTDPNGISAVDRDDLGLTLPAGSYRIANLAGVDEKLAWVVYPTVAGKLVCIGRNDPGVTITD